MSVEPSQSKFIAQAKHRQALELIEKQQLAGALRLLGESLAQEETSERWNDWSVVQFTAGQFVEAEQGFLYALELDPENREVAGNLGVLLIECEREHEAIPFLEHAVGAGDAITGSATADALLTVCRDTVATWLAEFEIQLRQTPLPLEQIPRWPLTKYAFRLAQLGESHAALEMVLYNRHFHMSDVELIRMQACIEMLHRHDCMESADVTRK
jgi:tetratricopeptide (TPR) repeat protein